MALPAREMLYVGAGGFLGADSRFLLSRAVSQWFGASFPYATLLINASGSFILGFFLIWTTQRVLADYNLRMFVAVGFCGGYTTFSSYTFETFSLFEQGQYWLAVTNFPGNNVLALAAAVLGAILARSI
jgi:fluoride exporter